MKRILIALLLLAAPAWATSYYVDCTNGSNGGAGSFQQPWRTPLEVSVHAASPGFNAGDAIYFHRDCTWHDGIRLAWISGGQTNSGSSGSPIVLDSYGGQTLTPGTGAPPHFTGMLPIPNNQCNGGPSATKACWCQGTWSAPGNVPTCTAGPAHLWSTRPLFDANPGDNCFNDGQNCIQCPSAGLPYSCFDQPITALTYVRFGTIWGNDQEVAVAGSSIAASLTQDRDWYFDTSIVDSTRQTLFVYCTCTGGVTPDVYYGTVAPIAISGEDAPFAGGPVMLNLLGVQWIQAQHLLFDWYTGIGIFIQSTAATPVADHIWVANVAANSYVENGAYRFNATGALCIWSSTPPCASNNGSGGTNVEQYTQIGLWVNNYSATGLVTPFTDIHVWNSDFMMNNLGVQVGAGGTYACSTCLVDLKNDRIYGSRTYGLRDNLGGAAQLSYSHLYGNNLATALETDVQTQWNLPALGISCSAGVVTAVFPSGNVPPFALAPGQKISVQTGGISGLTIPALAGSFTVASYSAGTLTWVQSPCPTGTYPATGGSINMVYANDRGNNLPYVSNLNLNAVTGAIDYSHMQMPWVQNWVRWTPYVMLNYDDPGLVQYSDNYVAQALPLATSRLGASHFSVATVTGGSYSGAQVNGGNANPGFVSEIQGWIGAGYDVLTHSASHGYWKPPAASCGPGAVYKVPCHIFNLLHYTGSVASTVTLSVTHSGPTAATLTIASSPSDPALALFAAGVPLAPQYPWSGGGALACTATNCTTLSQLRLALDNTGVLATTTPSGETSCGSAVCADQYANLAALAHSLDDTYSSSGVKGLQSLVGTGINVDDLNALDTATEPPYFEYDEMSWAQNWMNNYLTGLPAHRLYVMPGTYGDSASETVAAGLGYAGVRGTGSLKPCCAANTTLANGYDKFNILSQGVNPSLQNLSYLQMRALMQADIFKNALWGRPIAFFWHIDELPYDQVENMFDAVNQALPLGDNVLGDTAFVNAVLLNAPAAGHVPLPGQCVVNDMVPPIGVGDSGTTYVANSFYACASTGAEANWQPTVNSPTNHAGVALGSPWNYNLNGAARFTWGIGAL